MGDFVLRGRLGAGGMGEVFLGHSPSGRLVAVKVVFPHLALQPEFQRRFEQEITAVRAVSGAFTAPVVGSGPQEESPWLATLYIPGPTLDEAVAKAGALPESAVWPLAAGLVEALRDIHAARLLHRDLKPSNVLLGTDGPRVIDFGIARALEGTALTGTGLAIGTPGFMSPEQAEGGEMGPASDVFALGAVIAFAATGGEPFGQGPPLAVLYRVISTEPRIESLRGPLRALVVDCLAKNARERPTLGELLERITAHWDPPEDLPSASAWPPAVTTLIQNRAVPPTVAYTDPGHVAGPPQPAAQAPPATAPDRQAPPRPAGRPAVPAPTRPAGQPPQPPVTGQQSPETLTSRHNEARDLGKDGGHARAARLMAEVAADRERVLGPDHPDTLLSRHEHAYYLGESGKHAQAAALMAQVAADRARVLGATHHRTLTSRYYHARNLAETGEYAAASRLMAEVAAAEELTLGPDHRSTLLSRYYHARYVADAGEYAEGALLMAQVAATEGRVYGLDHPDTLVSRHQHAYYLGQAGEHAKAVRHMAEVVAGRTRTLGADHRRTLTSRHVHALNIARTGDHALAARLMAEVAADRARVLGPDHHSTLSSRHEHARYLGKL
ncbi:tetratricopeptide repeat protein [Streptomyces sp. NPDC050560]|uniref:serine/threonine-protein kinase n=1 Tax=Streptomyces sp. NPDC050560 TaxID=3365630 RepID=UPI0037BC1D9D